MTCLACLDPTPGYDCVVETKDGVTHAAFPYSSDNRHHRKLFYLSCRCGNAELDMPIPVTVWHVCWRPT